MQFDVRVSSFRTRPFTPSELGQMNAEEYEKHKTGYCEKVLAEEVLGEFVAESLERLGEKLTEIAESRRPNPLIMTTGDADELPLKHSFLIKRSYVSDDEQRMFELILFRPKDKADWQEKMDRSRQEWGVKRASLEEQLEFTEKAFKQVFEESAKAMDYVSGKSSSGPSFRGIEELRSIYAELQSRSGDFATDEEFANYFVTEFSKRSDAGRVRRREELVRKPPYYASQMPSILNDEMTVLCRIIGKDKEDVYRCHEYYNKFHRISEPVFSVNNDADDGLHVSFVYGKNFAAKT